ncbi:MAG TPA: protein kinase [Pyrinomonadaceae bacterium]
MLTPDTILQGRYKIVRQLGQGGMGTVYEAVDQRLDTVVALKETFFADERLRKQFEREARLLARLHHQALPRVSDHFSEGEGQFLVMQFIPGDDLSEMMNQRRGPFPAEQVLNWGDQLLDALDYLHTQESEIVHRDIKPQNLKMTSRGQIILLDFGLAKGQAGDISRITTSASIFGYTPNYAPLEQIQGLGTDSRSDLYSLAATLYHLLTGTKPPDALTRAASLVNGQPDPLAPATELNPAVAPEVSAVLQQALAQNREQRFPNAAEMRKALHRTEHTSTIINRGEAQTILRAPSTPTVAASTVPMSSAPVAATQVSADQKTVATGETTIVRPLVGTPKRNFVPWALSGVALLVAGSVLCFYLMQKRSDSLVQVVPSSPSPEASPVTKGEASTTPPTSPSPDKKPTPETKPTAPDAKNTRRSETPTSTPEPKRQSAPETETPKPPARDSSGHEDETIEPPRDPRVPNPNRQKNQRPSNIQVAPGGVVIRNFPDGSKTISVPDGTRIRVFPDGRQQVLSPARRPNRQKPPNNP